MLNASSPRGGIKRIVVLESRLVYFRAHLLEADGRHIIKVGVLADRECKDVANTADAPSARQVLAGNGEGNGFQALFGCVGKRANFNPCAFTLDVHHVGIDGGLIVNFYIRERAAYGGHHINSKIDSVYRKRSPSCNGDFSGLSFIKGKPVIIEANIACYGIVVDNGEVVFVFVTRALNRPPPGREVLALRDREDDMGAVYGLVNVVVVDVDGDFLRCHAGGNS